MKEETKEVTGESLYDIGASFTTVRIGDVTVATLEHIQAEIDYRIQRIKQYIPYMVGLYCEDVQRQHAEREIFRLNAEIATLAEQLPNTLGMVLRIGYPVTINT